MADDKLNDDDYVANLLKEDAKKTAKQYKMVGLDAFLPQRAKSGAPKPNTRFLRHLIRETDNHNAALLAREAEDSRARLKKMDRSKDTRKRDPGRLTPPDLSEEEKPLKKRKRSTHNDEDRDRERRLGRGKDLDGYKGDWDRRREGDRERNKRGANEGYEDSEGDYDRRRPRHSKQSRHRKRRHGYSIEEDGYRSRQKEGSSRGHKRRRSYSRSASRSRSPAVLPRSHHRSSRHGRRSRSRSTSKDPELRSRTPDKANGSRHSKRKSPALDSDSDPLEAIVGPLPPPPQPAVRLRGRGAHKANSMAMDARFSSTYDPTSDVHLNSDAEDDWGDALEALKDRQRWKQQGAERLKAAGFTDEEVKRWEKGDEKTEEDVTWARKGEGREWDRGKVLDEDGDVDLKADWGRLK